MRKVRREGSSSTQTYVPPSPLTYSRPQRWHSLSSSRWPSPSIDEAVLQFHSPSVRLPHDPTVRAGVAAQRVASSGRHPPSPSAARRGRYSASRRAVRVRSSSPSSGGQRRGLSLGGNVLVGPPSSIIST